MAELSAARESLMRDAELERVAEQAREAAKQRRFVCMEIVTSEEAYVETLDVLCNVYRDPLHKARVCQSVLMRLVHTCLERRIAGVAAKRFGFDLLKHARLGGAPPQASAAA